MRSLTSGEKGFEKYPRIFAKKIICLNEYTTSVKAEHDPRGPEGPYQFKDRSVPVIVFKRWDGETLVQQLGFGGGAKQFAQFVDRALKKNGPVTPTVRISSKLVIVLPPSWMVTPASSAFLTEVRSTENTTSTA